ncbi:FxsA family protein [Rubrimonas cliftonensis]|uniref:UPF0716 protein FxsA n=1 Tax=Rubrimonas cliftonensis TaxID=89524 RepID=A0A1H4D487_9RHOB|nr:FxsA family protein [Rubrimonas cliftonensis]SEA67633.1 UPF0716 protein FxsA [Rubrimonas cliftonensis]
MPLLIALLVVPLVEIALFVQVGGAIGLWSTIGLVILTAVAGTVLLRAQGFAAISALQSSLERGEDPSGPLAHGALLLLAGALLLTPGFFTDAVGLALMAPQARAALIRWAGPRVAARVVRMGPGRGRPAAEPGGGGWRGPVGGEADAPIEAEYREIDGGADAGRRDGDAPR